ncbi:MAG: hypothetical protein K8R74_06525 [Bacteroidales bacterium]|nr:hypothetical protein [Bacteroidales bacterium]
MKMKKLMLIIIAIVFLGGCSSLYVVPTTELLDDNIYSTPNPKFKIVIDKEFVYVRGYQVDRRGKHTKYTIGGGEPIVYGCFLWKSKSALIVIYTKNLPLGTFVGEDDKLTFNSNTVIEEKNENLGGKVWRTGIYSYKKLGFGNAKEWDWMTRELGSGYPDQNVAKMWMKKFMKKFFIKIHYIEILNELDAGFSMYTMDINRIGSMSDAQKAFVEGFTKRADAAITIMK